MKTLAAMSIDLEDWFQVENLRAQIPRETWDDRESRVERNAGVMLEHLEAAGVRATFFVLGWIAERYPELVRRVAAAGHEIASHGYGHDMLPRIGPDAFREDLKRSKAVLEDAVGARVDGYRAPSFSITEWAVDILAEEGFTYDSSAFPTVAHDRYGRIAGVTPSVPVSEVRPGLYEVGPSSLPVWRGIPWAGGGYFRMIPYRLFVRGVRSILGSGKPYVFYIHPWEIDPGQPRVPGLRWDHALRHYRNLHVAEERFAALLREADWTTMGDVLKAWRDAR